MRRVKNRIMIRGRRTGCRNDAPVKHTSGHLDSHPCPGKLASARSTDFTSIDVPLKLSHTFTTPHFVPDYAR